MVDIETKKIFEKISEQDWLRYDHQLILYAESRCKKWQWRTGNKENLPKGFSPKSIAREAERRLWDGTSKWNHKLYPGNNPVPFLKSVVKGLVSNLGHSKSHSTYGSLEQEDFRVNGENGNSNNEIKASDTEKCFRVPPISSSPYEALYFKEIQNQILDKISDREDLVKFFKYRFEGYKLSEIADFLQISLEQVKTLRRLFVNRTNDIRKELFEEITTLRQTQKGGLHLVAKKRNDQ